MKRHIYNTILLVVFLFLPLFFGIAQSTITGPINWYVNLDFAKLSAKEYKKPLFLFFIESTPSAVSNSVYNSTLSNEIIANKINTDFIPVKIQGDNIIQRNYNVSRFPTLLIVDYTDNAELIRQSGIVNSDSVFSLLDNALKNLSTNIISTKNMDTSNERILNAQTVTIHKYDTGAFISLDNDKWIHSTALYPRIPFSQFNVDDKYIMIANRELNVYFAIPIKGKGTFWTLKKAENEDNNAWIVAGRINIVQNSTISDYIKEYTLIGQENAE